jgi:CheY-like chemotaxis protein
MALTALAMAADQQRCLEAGADAYLAKPVKLKDLAAQIQVLLSRDRSTSPALSKIS